MWGLIFAGVSAAAGAFSAVDGYLSNRAIRESLSKIIDYLKVLDTKLDEIVRQNKEILEKLDELPRVIRAIVQEIVDFALLDERYATLQAIKLNILELKLDRRYRITEPGWRELSEALTYLFLHENRISYLFKLILACELALAATRNQAQPFIVRLLKDKITLLHDLRDDYKNRISLELTMLKGMLDQTQYIAGHNLSENLDDFDKLTYAKQPDRLRTISYSERVCHWRSDHCGNDWEVCHDEPRTRQEPDTPFHAARDNLVGQIEQKKALIHEMLVQLRNLLSVVAQFENYLSKISGKKALSENVTLFHPRSGAKALSTDGQPAALSAGEASEYGYYLDDVPALDPAKAKVASASATEVRGRFEEIQFRCPVV
ncbi:hypothetical protein [Bradyrhizobium nanningense]|nr:hypothetical protein [Bradyrhizobium nanningense]